MVVNPLKRRDLGIAIAVFTLILTVSCDNNETKQSDHPRLSPGVALLDVTFRSAALGRDMQYRVMYPASIASKLPVVYLLHGAGSGFRDWSNYSDVSQIAEANFVLVMPQGDYSYYVNAVEPPQNRYEDYIVQDLISDAEARFPIAKGGANRAIIGVSMGGFGAINIALSHPGLFAFAGGLSTAIEVTRRPFSIKRIGQYRALRSIFGPSGSDARRRNDPFLLARSVAPGNAPYLFLTCGEDEELLPSNREFAALLAKQHLAHEFHVRPGGHEWKHWNEEVPVLRERLLQWVGRQP